MNKFVKFLLAILGAVEVVFSIFIPIAMSLILINVIGFNPFQGTVLIIAGILSSLYRGIRIGFIN